MFAKNLFKLYLTFIPLILFNITKARKISKPKHSYQNNKLNTKTKYKKNSWTVLIYMAADNDLFPFAGRNIKQAQNVGSNENLKIVIHFDMHRAGQQKVSKRLLIEKNKIIQIGSDATTDSGKVNTLIDFCKWGIEKFSSDNYAVILWNHGTGINEPEIKKGINPSALFRYNQETKLIELNRKIGFLDYINSNLNQHAKPRGICIDDTTGNYLTNKNLKYAFKTVSQKFLHGKKISILACDACLMSMVEVTSPLKDYVDYFVGSEEVVLGTGYDYSQLFQPFLKRTLNKSEFAHHIVQSYKNTYGKITHDYTQSALDLSKIAYLKNSINNIAKQLIYALQNQHRTSVKEAIKLSKHKNFCTVFDEPAYIDLGHFYSNLLKNINRFDLKSNAETQNFRDKLKTTLNKGIKTINTIVIENIAGRNLKGATGVSIYFPEYKIDKSYYESEFANKTSWLEFLTCYTKS